MESPEINSCLHGQLTFDKGGKSIQWSKDSLFNQCCWENWTDWYMQKKVTRPLSYTTHQNKAKGLKDLNISRENIKSLEENSRSNIFFANVSYSKGYKGKNK